MTKPFNLYPDIGRPERSPDSGWYPSIISSTTDPIDEYGDPEVTGDPDLFPAHIPAYADATSNDPINFMIYKNIIRTPFFSLTVVLFPQ